MLKNHIKNFFIKMLILFNSVSFFVAICQIEATCSLRPAAIAALNIAVLIVIAYANGLFSDGICIEQEKSTLRSTSSQSAVFK